MRASDFDAFGDVADFEGDVDFDDGAGLEHDVFLDFGFKAVEFGGHRVGAGNQGAEAIGAGFVGNDFAGDAGGAVDRGDGRAGGRSAGGV